MFDGKRDTIRSSYAIKKYAAGLSYPTHFLKNRGSVIRYNFLEYRTNLSAHFAQRNYFYALLAINKAEHKLIRRFSCSCSDTIYSKRIKKNGFLNVYHFSISQYVFRM